MPERSETEVYAIGVFGDEGSPRARQGRHELNEITDRTGGVAYYPTSIDQVETAALEIARQIRSQYTIAYSPTVQALDGSFRRIRVEARGRGRERYVVRTRAGYRATAARSRAPHE